MRRIVSCVQLINSPSAIASRTICLPGMSSSTPIISPTPRTSLMKPYSLRKLHEPHPKIAAGLRNLGQQGVQDVEKLQRDPARQWTTAKRGPVHSRSNRSRRTFIRRR